MIARCVPLPITFFVVLLSAAIPANAQPYEAVGLRALGMGGAFVAVADDATAGYWNPAGLATGRFFSVVLDTNRTASDVSETGERLRGSIVAIGTPPLGVSYYRLTSLAARESVPPTPGAAGGTRLGTLRTSHVGVTLVQTIIERLHAGATLRYVRGHAASALVSPAPSEPLDLANVLPDAGSGAFDLDLGLMADFTRARVGLAMRNVRNPAFTAPLGDQLRLGRQLRAGAAVFPTSTLTVAVDADLTTTLDVTGERRSLALGAEQRLLRERVGVRGGVRLSTTGPSRSVATAGASVALRTGVYADGYVALAVGRQASSGGGAGLRVIF